MYPEEILRRGVSLASGDGRDGSTPGGNRAALMTYAA